MNAETIAALCKLNNNFYRSQSASFSETRNHPWPGWKRCLEVFASDNPDEWHQRHRAFSVLDVACGNLRFEVFLAEAFLQTEIEFYAVDNCDDLVSTQVGNLIKMRACTQEVLTGAQGEEPAEFLSKAEEAKYRVHYQSLDVMEALQGVTCAEGTSPSASELPPMNTLPLANALAAPTCDLTVSFGFMHHIPSVQHREEMLASLVAKTRPGGYVAVSFWQFLKNDALAAKAQVVHEQAAAELALPELEEGDYLLGWKNTPGAYRYCHHFSEKEIDQLATSVANKAEVVARFTADGRTENLNSYLVLRRSARR